MRRLPSRAPGARGARPCAAAGRRDDDRRSELGGASVEPDRAARASPGPTVVAPRWWAGGRIRAGVDVVDARSVGTTRGDAAAYRGRGGRGRDAVYVGKRRGPGPDLGQSDRRGARLSWRPPRAAMPC